MRKGLFFSALLATTLVGSVAMADRSNDDDKSQSKSDLKQRVLEKQSERPAREVRVVSDRSVKTLTKINKTGGRGDIHENYGKVDSARSNARTATVNRTRTANPLHGKFREKGELAEQGAEGKSSARGRKADSNKGNVARLKNSPAAKDVRSGVHMKNDKGEINNNIRGNSPMAQKLKLQARTWITPGRVKVFSWEYNGAETGASWY
jgi:hypothetical protein